METQKQSELNKRTMRRVRLIYTCRTLIQPAFVRIYILAGVVWALVSSVSIHDVMNNATSMSGMHGLYVYTAYALMHTEKIVQIGLLLLIGIAILLVRDVARRSIRVPFLSSSSAL